MHGLTVVIPRGVYAWARAGLCASLLLSMGCTPGGVTNIITGMSFSGRTQRPNNSCQGRPDDRGPTPCTPELLESLLFAKIGGDPIVVGVKGTGSCSSVTVDFGDGDTAVLQNAQLNPNQEVFFPPHNYTKWPGKKQVKVKGEGCLGEVTKELSVGLDADGHEEFRLGFVPNTMRCNPVGHVGNPSSLLLRVGSVVRVEAEGKIRYGVMEHDASGDRTMTTPADYAFPGFRAYSLVYMVGGSQMVQGENGPVVFTVTTAAPMAVCVNDHPMQLADNVGSIFLKISVNESNATP